MAVLKAPLLSLGATGQIGKAIVFSTWKGVKTARQHVTPANPQTAAQTTQRDLMTLTVAAWKNYFTGAEGREAWNRWALNSGKPQSGFNGFSSQVLKVAAGDGDASFVNTMTELAGNLVKFGLLNVDDGAAGDEAGTFDIWAGSTVSGMTLNESVAIVAGEVIGTNDLGDAGDVVYCKLRKGGYDRSGVFKATLID